MNLMSCGKDKATRLFRELDQGGIGLIERKKQGQGRPTRIYVKNFTPPSEPGQGPAEPPPQPVPPFLPQTAEKTLSGPLDSTAVKTAQKTQSRPRKKRSLHRWKQAVLAADFPPLIRLREIRLIGTSLNHPSLPLPSPSQAPHPSLRRKRQSSLAALLRLSPPQTLRWFAAGAPVGPKTV